MAQSKGPGELRDDICEFVETIDVTAEAAVDGDEVFSLPFKWKIKLNYRLCAPAPIEKRLATIQYLEQSSWIPPLLQAAAPDVKPNVTYDAYPIARSTQYNAAFFRPWDNRPLGNARANTIMHLDQMTDASARAEEGPGSWDDLYIKLQITNSVMAQQLLAVAGKFSRVQGIFHISGTGLNREIRGVVHETSIPF